VADRASYESLEAALRGHPRIACVAGVLFEHLEYGPTGEQVEVGYRCFDCDDAALLAAFARRDPGALAALPPAIDQAGAPTPSRVRLDLAFAPCGGLAAAQPVRYDGNRPVPASPPLILTGEAAGVWATALAALDQQPRR